MDPVAAPLCPISASRHALLAPSSSDMQPPTYHLHESPLGPLLASADEQGRLERLHFLDAKGAPAGVAPEASRSGGPCVALFEQIDAYFAGELCDFEVKIATAGSPFEEAVWAKLREIPYGETISYGELAAAAGRAGAARAAGSACGRNQIAIVVPCHRVVAADGRLTGYAGGLHRKRALLTHERSLGQHRPR